MKSLLVLVIAAVSLSCGESKKERAQRELQDRELESQRQYDLKVKAFAESIQESVGRAHYTEVYK